MELDLSHRFTFMTATAYTNNNGTSVDVTVGDTLALASTAHTVRGSSTAEIVPDSFRLFFQYMPALKAQWNDLRLRLGGRFVEELRTPRRWRMDEISPFERVRILDPKPDLEALEQAYESLTRIFPVFKGVQILDRWAGMIDVSPDVIPVIGPVASTPGFFIASGFSGHGFKFASVMGEILADLTLDEKAALTAEGKKYRK
jgi:glycine/D-amino acid oxidase-like deaminating enzyme